jgi:hypothetical protein
MMIPVVKYLFKVLLQDFKQGAFCITYPNGDRRFLTAIF